LKVPFPEATFEPAERAVLDTEAIPAGLSIRPACAMGTARVRVIQTRESKARS
jgi:hypothetical protein